MNCWEDKEIKVPNCEKAVVNGPKLKNYCLNLTHPRGKHKTRGFQSALGLTKEDTSFLRKRLLEEVKTDEAKKGNSDRFGQRYLLDRTVSISGNEAAVRSAWTIKTEEDFPHFVSCYILTCVIAMDKSIELLEVVALTEDISEENLPRGPVETVVEILDEDTFEIEFVDTDGNTYAQCAIPGCKLMRLQYEPAA